VFPVAQKDEQPKEEKVSGERRSAERKTKGNPLRMRRREKGETRKEGESNLKTGGGFKGNLRKILEAGRGAVRAYRRNKTKCKISDHRGAEFQVGGSTK